MFSFVFDSDDSVLDIVAYEMLCHISAKRDDSGAVYVGSAPCSVCILTHPERNAK